MKNLFKKIIREFHERGLPGIQTRELNVPIDSGKIVSIIGPRRAGKTYFLYQIASHIDDITDIVYINFEDERFSMKKNDLQFIIEAYLELYPDKKYPYLLFDEIQEIEGWDQFVRRIYDTFSKRIFLTGSSAKLLSREIATSLRGRTVTYELYPLSFREFLSFKYLRKSQIITTREQSKTVNAFEQYLQRGGFPEVISFDQDLMERIIKDYSSVMLLRDIIDRYRLRNSIAVNSFFDRCLGNYAKEISITKLFNELKSLGVKITRESLYEFIKYFEEAFIVFPLTGISEKLNKKEIKKVYIIDHVLSNVMKYKYFENHGRNLENIVYIELRRSEKPVYFHRNKGECDFIVKEKNDVTSAIQVCYTLTRENEKREVLGLTEAMDKFGLNNGMILTFNQENQLSVKGKNINILPVWKWIVEQR